MSALGDVRPRLSEAWSRRRRLGASDCERIRPGLIAQPANTVSSLAYVAAGVWVAAHGRRRARPAATAFGALLGAVGLGSVLYHGPCPPGARAAHDTTLAAALGLVVAHNVGEFAHPGSLSGAAQVGAAAGAASVVVATERLTNPLVAVLGVAAIAGEVASVRADRSAGPSAVAAALLAAGALLNVLGRSGGPWCRPDGRFQPHALWHVCSAASLAAWAAGALVPHSRGGR